MDLKIEEFNQFLISKNQLKGLTKVEFVKEFSEVYTRLNEIHPFREGNGRSTRIYLAQLAKNAGFELNIEGIEKDRWNYASHKAMVQHDVKNADVKLPPNKMEIRQIFHEVLRPTKEHAFQHETKTNALKFHADLKNSFIRLETIEKYAATQLQPGQVSKIISLEKSRIAEKLGQADNSIKENRSIEKSNTPIRHADKYEIITSAMTAVLQAKGVSQEQIDRNVKVAHQKLDAMKNNEAKNITKDVVKKTEIDHGR